MSRFPDEPPPPEPPRPSPPEEERAILPSRGRLALDEGPPVRLKAPRSSSPMPATRLPGRRFADHSGGGSERRTAAARPADVPVRPPSPGRGLRQPPSPGSPAAFPLDDDANDAGLGAFLAYSGRCQGKAEPCAPQAASRSVAGAPPGSQIGPESLELTRDCGLEAAYAAFVPSLPEARSTAATGPAGPPAPAASWTPIASAGLGGGLGLSGGGCWGLPAPCQAGAWTQPPPSPQASVQLAPAPSRHWNSYVSGPAPLPLTCGLGGSLGWAASASFGAAYGQLSRPASYSGGTLVASGTYFAQPASMPASKPAARSLTPSRRPEAWEAYGVSARQAPSNYSVPATPWTPRGGLRGAVSFPVAAAPARSASYSPMRGEAATSVMIRPATTAMSGSYRHVQPPASPGPWTRTVSGEPLPGSGGSVRLRYPTSRSPSVQRVFSAEGIVASPMPARRNVYSEDNVGWASAQPDSSPAPHRRVVPVTVEPARASGSHGGGGGGAARAAAPASPRTKSCWDGHDHGGHCATPPRPKRKAVTRFGGDLNLGDGFTGCSYRGYDADLAYCVKSPKAIYGSAADGLDRVTDTGGAYSRSLGLADFGAWGSDGGLGGHDVVGEGHGGSLGDDGGAYHSGTSWRSACGAGAYSSDALRGGTYGGDASGGSAYCRDHHGGFHSGHGAAYGVDARNNFGNSCGYGSNASGGNDYGLGLDLNAGGSHGGDYGHSLGSGGVRKGLDLDSSRRAAFGMTEASRHGF